MANGGTISRIDDFSAIPGRFRGGVAAIGNFDGIHRGHQAVLSKALEVAERENRPALVLTFEPHPRTVFRPENPLDRLTPAPVKARILEALGFDAVVEQEFSRDFAAIGSGDFVRLVLGQGLGIAHAVTGHNFQYGHDREGTPRKLAEDGQVAGFGVTCVDAFAGEDGGVVSSTRIRALLAKVRRWRPLPGFWVLAMRSRPKSSGAWLGRRRLSEPTWRFRPKRGWHDPRGAVSPRRRFAS